MLPNGRKRWVSIQNVQKVAGSILSDSYHRTLFEHTDTGPSFLTLNFAYSMQIRPSRKVTPVALYMPHLLAWGLSMMMVFRGQSAYSCRRKYHDKQLHTTQIMCQEIFSFMYSYMSHKNPMSKIHNNYVNIKILLLRNSIGAAVAEWLSSWLAEQEDWVSILGLATWIFRDWLSPASKSRYGWKIAKSTLILKTTKPTNQRNSKQSLSQVHLNCLSIFNNSKKKKNVFLIL